MTVIHELGHTATAWLFASPALPSFDLSYVVVVSHILHRQPLLVVSAYAIFAVLLFRAKGDRPELVRWALAAVLYSVAMFSPLRGLLITAMGHGSELFFAGIFLYRALSEGRSPRVQREMISERYLWLVAGKSEDGRRRARSDPRLELASQTTPRRGKLHGATRRLTGTALSCRVS
jgi:hypothetical protein